MSALKKFTVFFFVVLAVSMVLQNAEGSPVYFPVRKLKTTNQRDQKIAQGETCPEGLRFTSSGRCRKVWSSNNDSKRRRYAY